MSGFRVDTSLLDDTVPQYAAVAASLEYLLRELRKAAAELRGESLAQEALARLEAAAAALDACAGEARSLSRKTREISECYQEHERRAAEIVDALPGSPVFSEIRKTDPAAVVFVPVAPPAIWADYVVETAPLIRGAGFPCEDWLFERLIKNEWMISQ